MYKIQKTIYDVKFVKVLLVKDEKEKEYAIKIFTDHKHKNIKDILDCEDCDEYFYLEIEILIKCRNVHIIKYIGSTVYEINKKHYPAIVLPYYFHTFNVFLKKKMQEQQFKKLFKKLLETLKYLHKLKVIHGDIKPANIMFNSDVLDFVLIDFSNSLTFKEGEKCDYRITTSGFISPENIEGRELTNKIDVYALAVTMIVIFKKVRIFSSFTDEKNRIKDLVERAMYVRRIKISELKDRAKWKFKLNKIFPKCSQLRDLLYNMLHFKDYLRYNVNQCLCHRYFKKRKRLITYAEDNKKNKTT